MKNIFRKLQRATIPTCDRILASKLSIAFKCSGHFYPRAATIGCVGGLSQHAAFNKVANVETNSNENTHPEQVSNKAPKTQRE